MHIAKEFLTTYASPMPKNSQIGCFVGFIIGSNIVQLLAAIIFMVDYIDYRFYALAGLVLFAAAPFWMLSVIFLILHVRKLRSFPKYRYLVPTSIVLHGASALMITLVITKYMHQ